MYWKINGVNIPVYGIPDKLKEYHTSKKDINGGHEVNPNEQYRCTEEDLYEETNVKQDLPQNAMENYDAGESATFDEISQWNQDNTRAVSATIYQKHEAAGTPQA